MPPTEQYKFTAKPYDEQGFKTRFDSMTWLPVEQREALFNLYKTLFDHTKLCHGKNNRLGKTQEDKVGDDLQEVMTSLLNATKPDLRKENINPDAVGEAIGRIQNQYLPKATTRGTFPGETRNERKDATYMIKQEINTYLLAGSNGDYGGVATTGSGSFAYDSASAGYASGSNRRYEPAYSQWYDYTD